MAKYGSDDLVITVGGTDLSNYVDEIDGVDIEALIQESHAFGDAWVEQLFSGVKRGNPITIAGFYDDTGATGPDAKLGGAAIGTIVAVVITWGGSKTTTFNATITNYRRLPVRNESTRFSATLSPTAVMTEA